MGRKITMTGKNAQYIEHRAASATPDNDREIRMEGDDAVYREYAYGQAGQPTCQQEEYVDEQLEDMLLTGNGTHLDEAAVLQQLKPIFYNNEEDVKTFVKQIAGMPANDITDLVNRWVDEKRISDYGNSRKGTLWQILHQSGLYTKSRQNWNRRVY